MRLLTSVRVMRAMDMRMLRGIVDSDCHRRHARWLEKLAAGEFDFGAVDLGYRPKGEGSWKWQGLGTACWTKWCRRRYPWRDTFMTSDWKHYHDAAVILQNIVVREILPRYGIVAA